MPNSIAFFPWVSIEEPLTVGPLRLIPYERRERPGDGEQVAQADIDGVLRAYALQKRELVSVATLVELGDWRLGQEADASIRSKLFRMRELVAFTALAQRRLFQGHFDYCNFDTYSFVVQHYQAGHTGSFSFSSRRRDGGTQHIWSVNDFAFLKPSHVEAHARMKLDSDLLGALLRADETETLAHDSIVEFNRANTDSQDVPTATPIDRVSRDGFGHWAFSKKARILGPVPLLHQNPKVPTSLGAASWIVGSRIPIRARETVRRRERC